MKKMLVSSALVIAFATGTLCFAQDKMTESGMYIVQDGSNATKYSAVNTFFRCIRGRVYWMRHGGSHRPLERFTSNIGIKRDTPAWKLLIEASDRVAGIYSTGLQLPKGLDHETFVAKQMEFNKQRVLTMRDFYYEFLERFELAEGNVELLEAFIENQMKQLVQVVSTEPRSHPEVQRVIAIQNLFEKKTVGKITIK